MLVNQAQHEERASRVQESVLAVLQYRIGELEGEVSEVQDTLEAVRVELVRMDRSGGRKPASVAPESPVAATKAAGGPDIPFPPSKPAEGALGDVVRKVRAGKSIRASELGNMVQEIQRPLTAGDLEASPK